VTWETGQHQNRGPPFTKTDAKCGRARERWRAPESPTSPRRHVQRALGLPLKVCAHGRADFSHYLAQLSHIHTHIAKDPDHFIILVFTRLDRLLRTLRPARSIVLAMDGPAPLAKLLTQRSRRRRAGRREAKAVAADEAALPPSSSSAESSEEDEGDNALSSLALTPGTPVMARLQAALEYWCFARLGRPPRRGAPPTGRPPAIELSSAGVPGEGELKLLARLLYPGGAIPAGPDDTHCVVGGDSDLLLMAMGAPTAGRAVWVLTDDGRSGGGGGGGGGRGRPPRGAPRFFSVTGLDTALQIQQGGGGAAQRASKSARPPQPSTVPVAFPTGGAALRPVRLPTPPAPLPSSSSPASTAARRDLAAISILASGNDYLPAVRGVRLAPTWRAYLDATKPGAYLAGRTLVVDLPTAEGPSVGVDTGVLLHLFEAGGGWRSGDAWRAVAAAGGGGDGGGAPPPPPPPPLPVEEAAAGEDDELRPPADPASYLDGLAWVLAMYATGVCPDYRFVYDARGPGVDQVARAAVAAGGGVWRPTSLSARPALPPAVCAAALLPPGPRGRRLAPAPLRPLWDTGSPVADLYAVCDQCEALADAAGAAQTALGNAMGELRAATPINSRPGGGGPRRSTTRPAAGTPRPMPPSVRLSDSEIDALASRVDALRDKARSVSAAQRAHQRSFHPYAPFPLARLEAAVRDALAAAAAVPASDEDESDSGGGLTLPPESMLAFDEPRLYQRGLVRPAAPGGGGARPPPPITLPLPPCPRMSPLERDLAFEVTIGPAGGGGSVGRRPATAAAPGGKGTPRRRPPPLGGRSGPQKAVRPPPAAPTVMLARTTPVNPVRPRMLARPALVFV